MRFHLKIMCAAVLGATTLGCGKTTTQIISPSMEGIRSERATAGAIKKTEGVREFKEPTGTLSLKIAIEAALNNNLELQGAGLGYTQSLYLASQARAWENPELEIELEEFTGAGSELGIEAVVISQEIELGGKRKAQARLADAEVSVATLELMQARADLIFKVSTAFVEILSVEAALDNARRATELVLEVARITKERVQLGVAPKAEQLLVNLELQQAELEILSLERELKKARLALSFLWGGETARFSNIQGTLYNTLPLPSMRELKMKLAESVDIKLAREGHKVSKIERDIVRIEGKSNISLSAGLGYDAETDDYSLALGMGMPLSVFDKNRGNIAAAECELKRHSLELELFELEASTTLKTLYEDALTLREKITKTKTQIIPAALMAHEAAMEGFRLGKFDYTSVIDASATVAELRAEFSETLGEYALVRVEIERLLAGCE